MGAGKPEATTLARKSVPKNAGVLLSGAPTKNASGVLATCTVWLNVGVVKAGRVASPLNVAVKPIEPKPKFSKVHNAVPVLNDKFAQPAIAPVAFENDTVPVLVPALAAFALSVADKVIGAPCGAGLRLEVRVMAGAAAGGAATLLKLKRAAVGVALICATAW